jgi:hypothetical protein
LRSQRQKHKQDAKREDENRSVTIGNFLIGQLGPLERELARKILSTDSFHLLNRLARTNSWQCLLLKMKKFTSASTRLSCLPIEERSGMIDHPDRRAGRSGYAYLGNAQAIQDVAPGAPVHDRE